MGESISEMVRRVPLHRVFLLVVVWALMTFGGFFVLVEVDPNLRFNLFRYYGTKFLMVTLLKDSEAYHKAKELHYCKVNPGAPQVYDSPELKHFASLFAGPGHCARTITVQLISWNGQFAYQLMNQLLPLAVFAYHSNRTLLIDTRYFVAGHWCSNFYSLQRCEALSSAGPFIVGDPSLETLGEFVSFYEDFDHLQYNPFMIQAYNNQIISLIYSHFHENDTQICEFYQKILPFLWQPLPSVTDEVEQMERMLAGEYIGIQVRWGDKYTEAKLFPSEHYKEILSEVSRSTGIKKVFLMSDDRRAFEELRTALPELDFISLIPEQERGNFQYSFIFRSVEDREENARRLLVEVSLLAKAHVALCSYSSFICKLIQTLRSPQMTEVIPVEENFTKWVY